MCVRDKMSDKILKKNEELPCTYQKEAEQIFGNDENKKKRN